MQSNEIFKKIKMKIVAWEPKSQFAALTPILWLNWLFGLSVFELAGRPQYTWSIIYDCICITAYFVLLFKKGKLMKDGENLATYQEIIYIFMLVVNVIVAIVSIILGFFHTEKLRKIIAKCEQIDNTLEPYGVEKNYTKTLRNVTWATFSWTIVMLSMHLIDVLWIMNGLGFKNVLYLGIVMHIPMNLNSIVVFTFCTFMRILQQKIHKLSLIMTEVYQLSNKNNVIMKYKMQSYTGQRIPIPINSYNRIYFIQQFLQVTRHVYLEIARTARLLNQIYCYQLLLELVVEFTAIVGTLYNGYFDIIQLERIMKFLENKVAVSMILWICLNCIKIIVVNNVCTGLYRELICQYFTHILCQYRRLQRKIMDERESIREWNNLKSYVSAQVIAQTLREINMSYLDSCIRDEVQQFSLDLILHPLCINAGGFVFLNNRLTTVFFGTITTYITILIQMSSTPRAIKYLTQAADDIL